MNGPGPCGTRRVQPRLREGGPLSIEGAVTGSALIVPALWPSSSWERTTRSDEAVRALRSRHYSTLGSTGRTVGPPGRVLVLRTADGLAAWITHWPAAELALDRIDAWRCSMFRNEGPRRSSELIREAMAMTAATWEGPPPDGWLTYVEPGKLASEVPGWCFRRAGWRRDRAWAHPRLIRLRHRGGTA